MSTTGRFEGLRERLAPLRAALLDHPLYEGLEDLADLRRFLEHHVFAVWDFMSLLKALQRQVCGVAVPWLPDRDREAARLVNAIVLGEETDLDCDGRAASHFDLYHRAMRACGADTGPIDRFLTRLAAGQGVGPALAAAAVPGPAARFVRHTFAVIDGGDPVAIASTFTFGREDLLPDVFRRVVDRLQHASGGRAGLEGFQDYLDRHIAVDGEEHGPMAARLVAGLCGADATRWQVAEASAVAALRARLALWDGLHAARVPRRPSPSGCR